MDTALFFEQFGYLARSPDGVQKLRKLILELAVRGKLVPQDPDDEPASELLKRIEAEKQRLYEVGEIQRPKTPPPIKEDEIPHRLPHGWAWERLGNILTFEYGKSLPAKARNDFGKVPVYGSNGVVGVHEEHLVAGRGIIIGRKGSAGAINVSLESFWATDVTYYVVPPNDLYFDYTVLILKSLSLEDLSKGIKPGLNRNEAYVLLVAIPPFAEQQRIVAKVDELMQLCDQLEEEQAQCDHLHERAAKSTLFHLTNASSKSEARQYWQYAEQYFPELFDRATTVEDLRATILQLAVQGRLVPQNPDDEPASELLKRIEEEKQRLYQAGEMKKPERLPPLKDDEKPYEIPQGWEWIRLGAVMKQMGAGSTPLGGRKVYVEDGIPFLRSQNVWNDGLYLDDVARISIKTHEKMGRTHVMQGDVLLNITGASIGRSCTVPSHLLEANVSQHVAILRLIDTRMAEYLHVCIISPIFQKTIMDVQVGVSREGLSMTRLRLFPFAVPPQAEQRRIVSKINELNQLCDQLEVEANHRRELSGRLLDSIIYHLFEPAAEI
ncbi:MAG: restriction endonuclease subunit S [Anaerolineae bacterium]|nr:restriction endonuclease subunit S [Anaerolineae bacterium]